jgi:hypothetical protein
MRFIMNSIRRFRLSSALLIACSAACLTANFANAQQASHGKFNLPVESQWGRALLPAGEYSFTLDHARPDGMFIVHGNGTSFIIPVMRGISTGKTSRDSSLLLVTAGSTPTIRSVYLGHLGMTAYFPAQRSKQSIVAQAPKLVQHIQISQRER